jgi:hypothetical protein
MPPQCNCFRLMKGVPNGLSGSEVILEQLRISILTAAALWASASAAEAGPCTSQIAATEQQINQSAAVSPPGGAGTPSAGQAIGAQLHHQPTPSAVENAEHEANAEGEAALEQARNADANGNADACMEALRKARHLYGLD